MHTFMYFYYLHFQAKLAMPFSFLNLRPVNVYTLYI